MVSVHPKNKWLDLQPFPTAKTEGDCTNDFVVFHNDTFTAQHDGYNQPFTVHREEGEVVKGDSRQIYYYWPYKDGKKKFKIQLTAAEMKCIPAKQ